MSLYHYQILRILQFLPEISGAMVSLLVVVDSGVVGGPMASLHHLVTDLSPLQTWQEGEAGQRQQHQMYTDMQTVIVTYNDETITYYNTLSGEEHRSKGKN